MFWKLGDNLELKVRLGLYYMREDGKCSVKRFDPGEKLVYLYRSGAFVGVTLEEIFLKKKDQLYQTPKPSLKKIQAIFRDFTSVIQAERVSTPELKEKGFKYLL